MSDAMWLEGKEYISSRRASELSGYAQDYIGQLARKGLVDARRVGGLWYICMPSLQGYKDNASVYVPQPPEQKRSVDVESLVSFDGKDHISAARAAKITGYHQDYVGQLARSGAIISRQVGNRWYVDRDGILAHKREKDSLLGAVQAQSVGITRSGPSPAKDAPQDSYGGAGPFLTYTTDTGDLLPVLDKQDKESLEKDTEKSEPPEEDVEHEYIVPIRTIKTPEVARTGRYEVPQVPTGKIVRTPAKTMYYRTIGKFAAAALTIVIVLSFGFATLKDGSIYGTGILRGVTGLQGNVSTASAVEALRQAGDLLNRLLSKELVYKRGW
ncbi:helix-turn-helix domain-containing protein [Candidatus Kaiserbacteria bacterium]|nr:helix-turn-helix domain-containing protein [Candidatus Kaiserbacteria bacterium]